MQSFTHRLTHCSSTTPPPTVLFRSMCSPLNRQLSASLIWFDFSEWIWPHMKSLWPISLHSALCLHLFHRGQRLQDATTCNINTHNINTGVGEPRDSVWRETFLHGCMWTLPFTLTTLSCHQIIQRVPPLPFLQVIPELKPWWQELLLQKTVSTWSFSERAGSSYTNPEVQGRGGGTCSSFQYKHKELCSAKLNFFCLLCKAHRGVPHGGTEQQGCFTPRAKSKCLLTERKYSCSDMAWHAQLWWKASPAMYINQTELFLKTKRSVCSTCSS